MVSGLGRGRSPASSRSGAGERRRREGLNRAWDGFGAGVCAWELGLDGKAGRARNGRGEEEDGGRFGWEMRRSGVGCGVEKDGVPPPSGGGRRCARCMRGMTGVQDGLGVLTGVLGSGGIQYMEKNES